MRVAVLSSHPVQYHGPLFRALAQRIDLMVYFAHKATPEDQARAGFKTPFDWDVDITAGYEHVFLDNFARRPGTDHFSGCDSPEVGERLSAGRFDALLLTGWHLKSYFQAIIAAKRQGIPVLVRGDSQLATPRSLLKQIVKALTFPRLLRLFDVALYVGERSRAYYLRYRFPRERLFFSPHCVDTVWFAERATQTARQHFRAQLGVPDGVTLALFAGKLVDFKRPDDLISAVALLRQRGRPIEVLIAGDGALKGRLMASAETLGVPTHFLGFRNQSEMPAVYAAADLLVLPSDANETWGLVANEALACGRPIIVSNACGCGDDMIGNGEDRTGSVFPIGDVAALATAVESVIDRPPALSSLKKMSFRYSIANAVDGVCAALSSLEAVR